MVSAESLISPAGSRARLTAILVSTNVIDNSVVWFISLVAETNAQEENQLMTSFPKDLHVCCICAHLLQPCSKKYWVEFIYFHL